MPFSNLKLSELISSLSYALDITEGQPEGHCVRCCWVGMHVGQQLQLSDQSLWDLYYTLLLKDLGCSSNAARICELYMINDHDFKRDYKRVDGSFLQVVRFVLSHTGLQAGLAERFRAILNIMQNGQQLSHELIQTRCERGAKIARQLRFNEDIASGIHGLDEHWDGSGKPDGLKHDDIPLYSRIALLAQVVDVFYCTGDQRAVIDEVKLRAGTWFDPALVSAFLAVANNPSFWATLASSAVAQAILELEPAQHSITLDDDYLDEITAAFGQIVDSKSPYTAGHSERVALYADLISEQLGLPMQRRRWLRRAAALHDVGKLGVSNTVLDKPGKLAADEWEAVKLHATFTRDILSRINAFSELAVVAGAHHEKLDGMGYPDGISAEQITLETRVITTADIFDAITAERPYRSAIPVPRALEMMQEYVGTALDAACLNALKDVLKHLPQ